MHLSAIERTTIKNQYKILSFLDVQNKAEYERYIEILEAGIEGMYYEFLGPSLSDPIPAEIYQETIQILTAYRKIEEALASLNKQQREKLDIRLLTFEGFDRSESHYSVLEFLVNRGEYQEFKGKDFNSRSAFSIRKYRPISSVVRRTSVEHKKMPPLQWLKLVIDMATLLLGDQKIPK